MDEHFLILAICLIFGGAAVLSTVALITRQSMLVAYIVLGIVLGPWGLKIFSNPEFVQRVGDIGIIFLLFLLGLHLPPQKLIHMLRKITWVGLVSSILFAIVGYLVAWFSGYSALSCVVVGAAMMFSSTIIGLKLLPTTILHHQHTGEVMISVLLFQDIIAIIVLLIFQGVMGKGEIVRDLVLVLVGFPSVTGVAFFLERYILRKLFSRFNRIKEYMFLLAIAWCLVLAEMASLLKLSAEIGAFIAGVSLATSPVSMYIAESLKPVRDFFLVMFFFAVGASFNLTYLSAIIVPAIILVVLLLVLKPVVYYLLLKWVGETKQVAWEVGVRLAQISEFSLIIAYVAIDMELVANAAAYLIEATTILSFIASSYWVVMRYPTPVAVSDRLRRD
ncbi:MAG: sodium:proton antiporter [Coxiella sp. RIFCSPHIGHO2_12_FULL_42_15]|nr:MAG: sodium:proton antiporter [Coxiella sp. RIFCSPHIGHO2_12_FULL_42_15]